MKILDLLKQRRIWIGILAVVTFALPIFGVKPTVDPAGAIDLFVNFFASVDAAVLGALALWSYFVPKEKEAQNEN